MPGLGEHGVLVAYDLADRRSRRSALARRRRSSGSATEHVTSGIQEVDLLLRAQDGEQVARRPDPSQQLGRREQLLTDVVALRHS